MKEDVDRGRRNFLKGAGALGLAALTGESANAVDGIAQLLEKNEAAAPAALELGRTLSKFSALLPYKYVTNPEVEGAVDKATTDYLNAFASTRGLKPEQRTTQSDFEALDFAVRELGKHAHDASVLQYLSGRLNVEKGKLWLEQENNPHPTGPEREA